MSVVPLRIPSPAERPEEYSAEELLREIAHRGGRVYRMLQQPLTFCLTANADLAAWLHTKGAVPYMPTHASREPDALPRGSYKRAQGGINEWDFYIHTIEVVGEETIWEAAGRLFCKTVRPADFA
jgi:hypothetical protein